MSDRLLARRCHREQIQKRENASVKTQERTVKVAKREQLDNAKLSIMQIIAGKSKVPSVN
jgi:hypothetical protein